MPQTPGRPGRHPRPAVGDQRPDLQPCSTARLIGRTPCTTSSPSRCRLVRLCSSDSHCWKRALRVVMRTVTTRPASPAGSRRPPCRAASGASCGPWWAAGRRRPCPRVWSVSCCRHRASSPSPSKWTGSPSRPVPSTAAQSGRAHSTNAPGKDRQPSSPSSRLRSRPSGSVTTGLQTTPTVCSPLSSGQSKTNIATSSPTWQAARPTPSAAYIVATMSAASDAQRVVVRRHGLLRRGASPGCPSG